MASSDYYAILGAPATASDAELKQAYRRRVRETHPDVGGDAVAFRQVQEAWETLGDPKLRASYDRKSQMKFDSTIFSEPQFHPGSPFDSGGSFPGFDPSAFDAATSRMAEQVRKMAAERATQNRFREQVEREVNDLRMPKWPLNVANARPVFGSLYASHRYAGVEYGHVARWRSRDAWFVRVLLASWVTVVTAFLFNIVILPGDTGIAAVMTWLFVVFAATFIGGIASAGGLIGVHIARWLNYTIPKRDSAA